MILMVFQHSICVGNTFCMVAWRLLAIICTNYYIFKSMLRTVLVKVAVYLNCTEYIGGCLLYFSTPGRSPLHECI